DELGVADAIADGVLAGAGDRLLRDLDAVHLARTRRRQEADRAGAAVQIPDHVVGAQLGRLDRERVEPLGHRGVRLHEGAGRDGELDLADALGEAVAAEEPGLLQAERNLGDAGFTACTTPTTVSGTSSARR